MPDGTCVRSLSSVPVTVVVEGSSELVAGVLPDPTCMNIEGSGSINDSTGKHSTLPLSTSLVCVVMAVCAAVWTSSYGL